MKPHKHAELIKAWADGAEIQIYDRQTENWHDDVNPRWFYDKGYRIKPEPKPEPEKRWMYIYNDAQQGKTWITDISPNYYKSVTHLVYLGKFEVER